MKLSFENVSRQKSLVGAALLCSLTVIGCSKQKEEKVDANSEEAQVEVVENDSAANNTAPVIQCNDQVALTQLTQSVKSSLNSQTLNLFNGYTERADANFSFSNANTAVNSILIDVANPKMLQEANTNGMVTCNASLSLTLPNKDVTRAKKVYETLEQNDSFSDYLQSKNITLNNNMLVSNNFNYVVGMQGGQSTARVVGQPAILAAAADVIARSQFQAALEESRLGPATNSPRSEPTLPAEPRPRPEPKLRPEPEQKQSAPKPRNDNAQERRVEPQTKPIPQTDIKSQTDAKSGEASISKPIKPAKPSEPNESLQVPTDEKIEMVIIEEDGTY